MRKSCAWNAYASRNTAHATSAMVANVPKRTEGRRCGRRPAAATLSAIVNAAEISVAQRMSVRGPYTNPSSKHGRRTCKGRPVHRPAWSAQAPVILAILSCSPSGDCGAPLIAVYQITARETGGEWPPEKPVWP